MGGPGSGRKKSKIAWNARGPENVSPATATGAPVRSRAPTAAGRAIAKSAKVGGSTDPLNKPPTLVDNSAKATAYQTMVTAREYVAFLVANNAPAQEIARHRNALLNATRLYGKLNGEGEVTEAMILRSPAWLRMWDAAREVMARHPKCASELAVLWRSLSGTTDGPG